jgi:hypothetical protein
MDERLENRRQQLHWLRKGVLEFMLLSCAHEIVFRLPRLRLGQPDNAGATVSRAHAEMVSEFSFMGDIR